MFKKAGKEAWGVVKRGNMFMLAIGLLLGASFGAVVTSLANDVIMAAIASLFKLDDVKDLKSGPVFIGKFLAALIAFLIVATIIFVALYLVFIIKLSLQARKERLNPTPAPEVVPTKEELILAELKKISASLEQKK
ncbi:MscL family protein [Mycoplasmopsis columbina]|uniref:Large-conductance mechanosensitive channel n=1 Tax=Mycoplasmopsis columbina SF7 TaxID=1037410 RepID=F9UKG6_9BACT|nr:MscL family protein [Mycoplasmopsis columbina]EGV00171.1 large-conductance mechanosensitive channel [Mycoplasmopsis columbina SF7]VEU77065.1 large conductance mechanosensitive channel protein [Mycoplasmopsis columbina]